MSDKDSIHRAAKLLLDGATMLNISCPHCKNPIYRLKNGDMRCANCDKKVIHESQATDYSSPSQSRSNQAIEEKIDQLTQQLHDENDPDKIIKLAETIKKLKEIL